MPKTERVLGCFRLAISEGDESAYLKLPDYPKDMDWKASRSVWLEDIIGSYSGPDVHFQFDQNGLLVGIEVLA